MIDEMSGDFFQQLRGFYYVAQLGSMGKAARTLHRSQSSVSRLIKQLEQSLGITLFSRIQKGVVLTEEGKELFKQSVEIFEKIRNLYAELDHSVKEPHGHVSFMASPLSVMRFFAPLLPDIHQEYPKIHISVAEALNFDVALKQLEERVLDFAIVVGGNLPPGLEFVPLYEASTYLATPPDMDLGEPDEKFLKKLEELPMIILPDGFGLAKFINHHLERLEIRINPVCRVPNLQILLRMVEAGMGSALVHDTALHTYGKHLNLRTYPLAKFFPPQVYGMVYLKNSYATPQAKAIREFFRRHATIPEESTAFEVALRPDDAPAKAED